MRNGDFAITVYLDCPFGLYIADALASFIGAEEVFDDPINNADGEVILVVPRAALVFLLTVK